LSKIRDVDDFGLSEAFAFLFERFGPFTVDRFASEHNAKLPRVNSFYWCPGVTAVNSSNTQDWGGAERNFCFPPPSFVAPTRRHARACRARMTLVVLGWRSAPWWPLLSGSVASGRGFASFVRQQLDFPTGREVLVPGRASRDRFFGKGVPISDVFALKVDFSLQVRPQRKAFFYLALTFLHFSIRANWVNFESWDLKAAGLPSSDPELTGLSIDLHDAALLCHASSTFCTYSGPWKRY
jgi:hypothetical protein